MGGGNSKKKIHVCVWVSVIVFMHACMYVVIHTGVDGCVHVFCVFREWVTRRLERMCQQNGTKGSTCHIFTCTPKVSELIGLMT